MPIVTPNALAAFHSRLIALNADLTGRNWRGYDRRTILRLSLNIEVAPVHHKKARDGACDTVTGVNVERNPGWPEPVRDVLPQSS